MPVKICNIFLNFQYLNTSYLNKYKLLMIAKKIAGFCCFFPFMNINSCGDWISQKTYRWARYTPLYFMLQSKKQCTNFPREHILQKRLKTYAIDIWWNCKLTIVWELLIFMLQQCFFQSQTRNRESELQCSRKHSTFKTPSPLKN